MNTKQYSFTFQYIAMGILAFTIYLLIPGYLIFKASENIYLEWNDNDSRVMQVVAKMEGVKTWTTREGIGKARRRVNHSAGAMWIKMQRYDGYTCTFAIINPFTAETYEIGKYYDMASSDECTYDPSPNGFLAFAWLLLLLIYVLACSIFIGSRD